MGIELLAPCRARIRKQDIHMVRRLAHFLNQVFDALEFSAVGGHRDRFRARLEVRESIEGFDGFVAGGRFAGCDVDFGGAGLEESGGLC
jgi:hypothetical protein